MTHDRNRSNIFLRNEFCTVRISQRQRGVASHLSDMVTAVLDVSIASHHVPFVYRHPKHRNTAIKRTARTIAQQRTNACRRCQIESQRVPRNLLIARSLARSAQYSFSSSLSDTTIHISSYHSWMFPPRRAIISGRTACIQRRSCLHLVADVRQRCKKCSDW